MNTLAKNPAANNENRKAGMTLIDDTGRVTVFTPNCPAPAVPYWNTALNGIHRGRTAIDKMDTAVSEGMAPNDLFEGQLVSNIPLGDDIRLKSEKGFWIGDAMLLKGKLFKNNGVSIKDTLDFDTIEGDYSVFSLVVEADKYSKVPGLFIPAGEIIVRVTGFLRYEGSLGHTYPPYEKMVEARKNGTAEELLNKYNNLEMTVTGYSPAACLIWVLDAKKMDAGATIESIGESPVANAIGVDSGTISGVTFEDASRVIKGLSAFHDEDRDGSVLGSSEEGFFSTGTALGDGGYFTYPVYNDKEEIIGHVIDLCSALGEQEDDDE